MEVRRVAAGLGAALAMAVLGGCGQHDHPWTQLSWHAASLPLPSGERALVRGATWCQGRWLVVGATADARGRTHPAVWASPDGRRWGAVRLHPGADYYAARAILTSVGCRDGRAAVLGAKSGGAHGLPRTATWRQRADGSLRAVPAGFELFGGENAVAVSGLVGGPSGYLIVGARTSGAAVWTSRTGDPFHLHEDVPGLADTAREQTAAMDAIPWRGAWSVVGTATDDLGRLHARAWTGEGERWRGTSLPGGADTTAERVTLGDSGPVAVGLDEPRFAVWTEQADRWSRESTFGRVASGGTKAPYVSGLGWTGSVLVATYSDGARFRLAVGPAAGLDGVPLPTTVSVRGDHAVTLATHDDDLLLLTDDGEHGRVWLTRVPGTAS